MHQRDAGITARLRISTSSIRGHAGRRAGYLTLNAQIDLRPLTAGDFVRPPRCRNTRCFHVRAHIRGRRADVFDAIFGGRTETLIAPAGPYFWVKAQNADDAAPLLPKGTIYTRRLHTAANRT